MYSPPHRTQEFYSKLEQTPDASLPKVEQLVTIASRQEAGLDARETVTVVDEFLVGAAIGGGGSKEMACLPEHRHMKLIPWGGVSF